MRTIVSRIKACVGQSLLWGLLFLAGGVSGQIAQPPNDAFTNRFVLSGLQVEAKGTNIYATKETGEPNHAGQPARRSVWWSWQAPYDGTVQLTVTNVGTPRVRWAVYTGTSLTNLNVVATNAAYTNRVVEFGVNRGQNYQIAVDELNYSGGTAFTLSLALKTLLLTQPASEARVPAGRAVTLSVTNLETDHDLVRVDYYAASNWVGAALDAPHAVTWMPLSYGRQAVSAIATNAVGERRETPLVWVTVVPGNDMFVDAAMIPAAAVSLELTGENLLATAEPGEPAHAGRTAKKSLWWRWTPAYQGRASFRILSAGSSQSLAVYTGSALTNLCLVSAITNVTATAEASFEVVAGQPYWVAVDGTFTGSNGAVRMQFALTTLRFANPPAGIRLLAGESTELVLTNLETDHPFETLDLLLGTNVLAQGLTAPWSVRWGTNEPGLYTFSARGTNSLGELRVSDPIVVRVSPTNDDFANALEIPAVTNGIASVQSTTAFATHENFEPAHLTGCGKGSVWFSWVAPWDGDICFSTEGSPSGSFIVVYQGSSLSNLTALTTAYSLVARVTKGERYYIAADACSGYAGPVVVSIRPPPPNNDWADALEWSGDSGTFQGGNWSANSEPGEPVTEAGNAASIWWRWTAPALGEFTFDTAGSYNMTVQAAVYSGDSFSHLVTELAPMISSSLSSSGSGITMGTRFRARAGRTYYFRFSGGYSPYYQNFSSYGTVAGSYSFTPLVGVPVNDEFGGRLPLSGLTNYVFGDNTLGSMEPGEPRPTYCDVVGRSLWYAYTAPERGVLRISATGQDYTMNCSVYRGETLAQLQPAGVSCTGPVDVPVNAGEVLQIAVDGAFGGAGPFTLQTLLYPVPSNDAFTNSVLLEGTNITFSGNNVAATLEPGELRSSTNNPGRTVWYSWVAPCTGRVTLSGGCLQAFGVYTGTSLESLQLVKAWSDAGSFLAREGTLYHLQVDGGCAPEFTLSLQVAPAEPATNDNFTNAIVLKGNSVSWSAWVNWATVEAGEPAHLGGQACKSLWWRWQAPMNGRFSLSAQYGQEANMVLALYSGDSLETLTLLAKGTNSVGFWVTGGTTYYLAGVAAQETMGDMVVLGGIGGLTIPPSVPVVGNLLCEPSFENTGLNLTCWSNNAPLSVWVNERGGADGATWEGLSAGTRLWQDFPTVPGRNYETRFAFSGTGVKLRVSWDGQELGVVQVPADETGFWHWTNLAATATQATTRLMFESLGDMVSLDAVSVVWMNEPPSILTQPQPASTLIGGTVSLAVEARGTGPLAYQWYLNGAPLAGQRTSLLLLEKVASTQAGQYSVVITNAFGAVTSAPATLVVEAPVSPTIVLQPYSETVAAGGYYALSVAAVGTQPLSYQWYRDGVPVGDATNRQLVFASFAPTNAGTYCVQVQNAIESVWSLPATLRLGETTAGGGAVILANHFLGGNTIVDERVWDVDGVTGLSGSNYVAQLYAGSTLASLRPVGAPTPFRTGTAAAGIFTVQTVTLPTVAPGATAYVQVRVWDRTIGVSYEEARALGSKFGRSEVFQVVTGGGEVAPPYLTDLRSFSVAAGLPQFVAGRIEVAARAEDGTVTWALLGQAGYRYVIERSTNFVWRPFAVLTNTTGTVEFKDPAPASQNFYRARILD